MNTLGGCVQLAGLGAEALAVTFASNGMVGNRIVLADMRLVQNYMDIVLKAVRRSA